MDALQALEQAAEAAPLTLVRTERGRNEDVRRLGGASG